jgi:hypothetical protein
MNARCLLLCFVSPAIALCQEAGSGFDLHGTLSGISAYSRDLTDEPRAGSPVTAGVRALLYPEWKIDENWSVSGAIQLHSRPYFYQEYATQGFGALANVIQAQIAYSRVRFERSLVVRAGILPAAFGSFALRYDDAVNPLIDAPLSYGYYGSGVSLNGFAGAQVDVSKAKLDARAQFLNSSPANRRSIFDRDQYGSWVAGAGYTIIQGFRVGASVFRGPYLDRHWPYYFPSEVRPRDLPATGLGLDIQWGRGHWTAYGEWQRFVLTYHAIRTYREDTGYGELRRVLTPRWYIAGRAGYLRSNATAPVQALETAIGYRPGAAQLIKFGYEIEHSTTAARPWDGIFAVQFVTTFRAISLARQ